jgi:hypothetical protein
MNRSIAGLVTGLSLVGIHPTSVLAQSFNYNRPQFACSSANDATFIRDYPTFKPVAKLNRGECMAIVPDDINGTPVKLVFRNGETFYVVTGASGNVRLVSTRYTRLR